MLFSRKFLLTSAAALPCWVALLAGAPAHAATIPDNFFGEWTAATNCTEQHAGLAARVSPGLKFKISRDHAAEDGSYVFEAEDVGQLRWAANWHGIRLEYRAGPQLTTLPADFECIPGQEASSPFLALSNYAQASEPYYEYAHWYGIATIHGQREHILIFPRKAGQAGPSVVMVMQSVNAPHAVQLDDDGVIQYH